ncbi:MAG TPA: ABC transporter C-terminal domain-containing protein [Candidatus Polarisedimenticolia bacterium]|jgi:hypothetical protein|nr:ABC transporter C-terminal domain-containing protein [Candidatus Polarisedimenticolia bacterium]
MKKVIILAIAVLAVWLGINYARTGKLAFFPTAASPAEERIHEIEQELASIDSQIASAGRTAGMTGLDTTSDVSALQARKAQLEKALAEARAGKSAQ